MDEEPQNSKLSSNTSAVAESDSILDFRSPESKITKTNFSAFTKSNIAKQKKKTTTKFKNSVKSHKETQLKLDLERSKSSQRSEASVESTFFKAKHEPHNEERTTDAKVALVCPLCFKTCKDVDSQVLHMKICACKNNISTRKLLDAIELQKRQENERRLLGLLIPPIVQDKKKQVSHRTNSHVDSDLQLALALSKSLQEAEELDEINGIERISEITNQSTSEVVELSTYKRQLEKIGFASKEPAPFIKSRRRRYNTITPLKTRSEEERNRILTERIAEILIGNEPITQKQKRDESDCNQAIKAEIVLKSLLLRRLCHKEDKLWDKARLTPSRKRFYVTNLSEYVFPQEKQMETEEESIIQLTNACEIDDKKSNEKETDVSSTCSTEKQFFEISQTDLCFKNEKCENCGDSQFTNSLIMIWGNALNDSSASDILIFVNNDKHIWVHKLVFYVRCSNILLDVVPNDTLLFSAIKEKICWLDVPYDIALAFLEFIYCGVIRKYSSIFEDSRNFCSLRNLARKYKVQELFAYLQKKEVEAKRTKAPIRDVENTGHEKTLIFRNEDTFKLNRSNSENLIRDRENFKVDESEELNEEHLERYTVNKNKLGASESELIPTSISNLQSSVIIDLNTVELDEDTRIDQSIEEQIDHLSQISTIRHSNVSPDMFDDGNDITLRYDEKCTDQMADNEETNRDATPESVILDFVNDITVDTTDSSKTVNTISSKNVEECINSLPITPHSSTSKITKLKSNLSLFIEQFQKENAKSDSDVDFDVSILSQRPKLNRNPFTIIQHGNSNDRDVSNENSLRERTLRKQQHTIDSKSDVQITSDESDTDMCLSLGSMEILTQSIKHKENGAERHAKNNSMNNGVNNAEEVQNNVTPSATKSLLEKSVHLKHLQYDRDQDSITSDTDADENEMSMYTRYKRNHRNNSIVKYRDFVKEHILNNSSESSQETEEYEKSNKVNNEGVNVLSDIDINFHGTVTSEEEHEGEKGHLSVDITTPVRSQRNGLNIQRGNNSNKLRYSKSESNIDVRAIRNNSLESTPKGKTNESGSVDSPVLICSSPEFDCEALNANTSNENKAPNNILNLIESHDYTHIFERDIYLANVHINDDDGSSPSPVTKRANRLYKSNSTLSYNKGDATSSTITNNENNELIKSKSLLTSDSRRTKASLTAKQCDRKFQRKSRSEASLNINKKDVRNDVSDANKSSNRDLCKCGHKRTLTAASPIIIRDNVTPPPDYDGMKSPELHVTLNKYGLKLQTRNRAVKLLTYIYNELHPTLCTTPKSVESEFAIISSEDEEPPTKRISYRKDEDELPPSQASTVTTQSPVNVINEKIPDNMLNIKDAFLKLIKVKKELYNNILAYNPLCIESVHSMLKEEGLKCKMNEVMDFLDEQCITFYFNKSKRNKIRKA
ncbi:uncharacterized protein LOC143368676 isoform X3 [Andrena cerasifolii]|uniref:uncharacterized protein LOC143368676 isoform X3 n=1 Tax=Andrena cerasifolii TaxID=2819439 RepID=UPI0040378F41